MHYHFHLLELDSVHYKGHQDNRIWTISVYPPCSDLFWSWPCFLDKFVGLDSSEPGPCQWDCSFTHVESHIGVGRVCNMKVRALGSDSMLGQHILLPIS